MVTIHGDPPSTARWILESGGGWVVAQDDLDGLMAAIQEAGDPIERAKRGQAALQFAQRHFQMRSTCALFAELLETASAIPQVRSQLSVVRCN